MSARSAVGQPWVKRRDLRLLIAPQFFFFLVTSYQPNIVDTTIVLLELGTLVNRIHYWLLDCIIFI